MSVAEAPECCKEKDDEDNDNAVDMNALVMTGVIVCAAFAISSLLEPPDITFLDVVWWFVVLCIVVIYVINVSS